MIEELFNKWVELTDLNPQQEEMIITNKNVNVYNYNNKIKSFIEIDNSGGYDTALIIQQCFEDYINSLCYSINDIINNTPEYTNKIKLTKEMKELLYTDSINEYKKSILDNIEDLAKHYDILEHISNISDEDKIEISFNAKKAIEYLDVVQFKKGIASGNAKLLKTIHILYNVLFKNKIC